jgi:hypothetical protein
MIVLGVQGANPTTFEFAELSREIFLLKKRAMLTECVVNFYSASVLDFYSASVVNFYIGSIVTIDRRILCEFHTQSPTYVHRYENSYPGSRLEKNRSSVFLSISFGHM